MIEQKVRLVYPVNLINKPLIYHLIRKFNLYTNIIEASVSPQEGRLVVILRGTQRALEGGLKWIAGQGVQVERIGEAFEAD